MRTISAPWSAVKAVGNGRVEGMLIRFTSPREVDTYGDYFDAKSRIDLEDGDELPLLWHHGLDPQIGKRRIGKGSVKLTKAGWWFQSILNLRDEYEKYMYELAKRGKLGYSSGADPQTVKRVAIKSGINHVARWDVLEGSLTPTPADFGNRISIKSLMVKAGARHSATDQQLVQAIWDAGEDICELAEALGATPTSEANEAPDVADQLTGKSADFRRRKLLLELELIEIEAEHNRALQIDQKSRLLADLDRLQRSI